MHHPLCLKKSDLLLWIKEFDFNLLKKKKIRSFVVWKKKKKKTSFWRENSDLCLLNKTKSFGLKKKKKSDLFLSTKKKRLFDDKKKIRSVFMCSRKIWKLFLRRGFHSWNKFMLHILNKTNTIMHDLFLYFKICICEKKIIINKKINKKLDLYLRMIQISFLF